MMCENWIIVALEPKKAPQNVMSQPSMWSHCSYCPVDVDTVLPHMHAGCFLSLAQA